ncbi:MAG TPA: ATP-binding protein [Acidimicrobiales bacterium]|nr:ATP-binding protein [Acidimicrobiales bacterium]
MGLVLAGVLSGVMLPVRPHLGPATTALVLVMPVVAAVSVGGFVAGIFATALCFICYDLLFLPPYYTLYVAHIEDWVALVVYGVVMVLVSRLVSRSNAAQERAAGREREMRRLFDVSELLVRELPERDLLDAIVGSVRSAFDLEGASLILPRDGTLRVVASAGTVLPVGRAAYISELPVAAGAPAAAVPGGQQTVALSVSRRPVGLLVITGAKGTDDEQERLRAFANHLALALERAQLREEALRVRLLEETDTIRRSLVGAVSHDLRTPLATIKVSASALVDSAGSLSTGEIEELAELVDAQADRLDRLVSNILDMTRIQAGTLELRRQPVALAELVEEAMDVLGRSARPADLRWRAPGDLPPIDVDPMLVRQVLANLLDNAFRHSPPGSPVTVLVRVVEADKGVGGQRGACAGPGKVEVRVTDSGPGIPDEERARVFTMSERREAGGRGGLGLAIVQAFLEVHGEAVRAEAGPGGRFVFTLPIAPVPTSGQ